MHDIEPWWGWRDEYKAEEDKHSPFYKNSYDEFSFHNKIYNYYIHPQWDSIGSETLFAKILYVDYSKKFGLIELIGEWNDCLNNDIMFLKRDIVDVLLKKNINKFVIFCDNVLNFHGDDDCYYEEWYDDIKDDNGWICIVNLFDHVMIEMQKYRLQYYLNFGLQYNNMNWRSQKPLFIMQHFENLITGNNKQLL